MKTFKQYLEDSIAPSTTTADVGNPTGGRVPEDKFKDIFKGATKELQDIVDKAKTKG